MPVLRQPPPNAPNIPTQGYQPTPPSGHPTSVVDPSAFNGQEYVNTLIDNLATKDNVRKDLFEKQNKTVI